ncbi:methionine--tRNA ligase [Bacillus salacetis]|uniref:Methionine--tRNA ligase n=1 Tax=Bacillus salacetis TaxID=2315464 RepID=A0A3A1R207_9BACI|nr:methionine--tRNA ligase [Bacillus salacetis]RIW35101.1 methionine--tRNA ligase [Bacillus salacetis]
MTVFIGGAWPYANGPLHIGHLAALLPGDILARYYRLKGDDVLYVSGSDCNGTPIEIRAKQEGVQAGEIADKYHKEFLECFCKLGFSYDQYGRTDSAVHHKEVQKIFLKLKENGHLYNKSTNETFCVHCDRFLPDRFVEGVCPNCGDKARGDQCDSCGRILNSVDLADKSCKLCGNPPTLKETSHYYLSLSSFQQDLEEYADGNCVKWRDNAVALTSRYIREGLQDRAATRDISTGVDVPVEGYEDKKIYVWIEAVSGYLTASVEWGERNGEDWKRFWDKDTVSYYVHGKDNIPFHTIIWPAVLKGLGNDSLPDWIVSSEYVTLEKKKISTSRNWAVWLPDILQAYHPDTLRYYFSVQNPDTRDADFSWREFVHKHNSDLLGGLGNFIQRTAKFYQKEFGDTARLETIDARITEEVSSAYKKTGELLEKGECRKAAKRAFELVRWSNKYFDAAQPWSIIKENRDQARSILENCLFISINLAGLLGPFLPFTGEEIRKQFHVDESLSWKPVSLPIDVNLRGQKPLFERIPEERIELERAKLG